MGSGQCASCGSWPGYCADHEAIAAVVAEASAWSSWARRWARSAQGRALQLAEAELVTLRASRDGAVADASVLGERLARAVALLERIEAEADAETRGLSGWALGDEVVAFLAEILLAELEEG